MGKPERIAYKCGDSFIYQGDMVWVRWRVDDGNIQVPGCAVERFERGLLLGLSSLTNHEPHNHLRVLVRGQVHCMERHAVFPISDV